MTLQDQGFRFCIRPDRLEVRWLKSDIWANFYPDWTDATDWPLDDLNKYLSEVLQSGTA